MDLNEKIKKIEEYFEAFNIVDGIAYVLVSFPDKWRLPDQNGLKEEFLVSVTSDVKGVYFFTEMTNTDKLFEAIDFVIAFNKEVEERFKLFNDKLMELKELFNTEDVDRLRKLTFSLPAAKKKKGKKKEEETKKEEPVTEPEKTEENNEEETSMMALAREIVEE